MKPSQSPIYFDAAAGTIVSVKPANAGNRAPLQSKVFALPEWKQSDVQDIIDAGTPGSYPIADLEALASIAKDFKVKGYATP